MKNYKWAQREKPTKTENWKPVQSERRIREKTNLKLKLDKWNFKLCRDKILINLLLNNFDQQRLLLLGNNKKYELF